MGHLQKGPRAPLVVAEMTPPTADVCHTSFLALGPTLLRGLHKDFLKFVTKTPFQGLPQVPHQDITPCVRQANKQEW